MEYFLSVGVLTRMTAAIFIIEMIDATYVVGGYLRALREDHNSNRLHINEFGVMQYLYASY